MEVNIGEKLWWEINEMVNTRESVDIAYNLQFYKQI